MLYKSMYARASFSNIFGATGVVVVNVSIPACMCVCNHIPCRDYIRVSNGSYLLLTYLEPEVDRCCASSSDSFCPSRRN